MADSKISALPSATTPLAGTEVLPIVQSGATKKVAVQDLNPQNIKSNTTSGILQVTGPAASTTRVMTVPNANFTAARTDASQTFSDKQTFAKNGTASTYSPIVVVSDGTYPNSGWPACAFNSFGGGNGYESAVASLGYGQVAFFTPTSPGISPIPRWYTEAFAGNTLAYSDNAYTWGGSGGRWSAIWAANGTIQTSDMREKNTVQESSLGLAFIKLLRPVSYKWNVGGNQVESKVVVDEEGNERVEPVVTPVPGKRTHWGFLAQDVKKVIDDFDVDFGGWVIADLENPESAQSLRYDQFIAPLVKAIQEQQLQIEELMNQVQILQSVR